MSDLDDELRQEVAAAEEPEAPATASAARREDVHGDGSDEPGRRGLGLLLGLLAVGGGALWLVLGSTNDSMVYDKKVHEVVALDADDVDGRTLNVEGHLVHGTLMKREKPCEYRFSLKSTDANQAGELKVHYPSCIVPDTFRDVAGMDVVVSAKGQLQDGVLQANHISTKCPTKYEMQQRQQLGQDAPHSDSKVPILSFDEG